MVENNNEILIYTKKNCPYCIKAKALLDNLKLSYKEIEINSEKQFAELALKTSWMTVPQIFINAKFIGGYDDLYRLHVDKKLSEYIK